jgi:hypothetical protein
VSRWARIFVSQKSDDPTRWTVDGDKPEAARAALFLADALGASVEGPPPETGAWDHAAALDRTARVRETFGRPELAPFDSHLFWGSWKWVGAYATEFTWVGRWIMQSMLTRDGRAVFLSIDWLRAGTYNADQSAALRTGLTHLTGLRFATDAEWIAWYDGDGKSAYPEPDFDACFADLKAALGERPRSAALSRPSAWRALRGARRTRRGGSRARSRRRCPRPR